MAWCRCADDSDMSCSMQVGYDEGASTPARAAEPRPPRWRGSPAGRSFIHTEDLVLAVPGLLDRPAASGCHRGRDHHEDGRDDDADDPPGPVNAARRRNTERGGEVVADEHTANPADNGEPERNVVAVARREELAQCADDDAGDDQPDDVHSDPFHRLGTALFLGMRESRPSRGFNPARGS